jgi:hypothetical protein
MTGTHFQGKGQEVARKKERRNGRIPLLELCLFGIHWLRGVRVDSI